MTVQPARTGRLGNQMSHYAFAVEFARRHAATVSYAQAPADCRVVIGNDGITCREFVLGDLATAEVVQIEGVYPDREPAPDVAAAIRALMPVGRKFFDCAIHVRRTDFVRSPLLAELTPEYYRRAMAEMSARIPGVGFAVFSDDPEYALQHFPRAFVYDVGEPATDLLEMASYSHHIIANSTFSWWAQFLGRRQGQVVVSPRAWFCGQPGHGEFNVSVH
jgi:hypothetical protein